MQINYERERDGNVILAILPVEYSQRSLDFDREIHVTGATVYKQHN